MHIYPHQDAIDLVDTIFHEGFHAAFPDIDDDAVEAACNDITRLLKRMKIKVTFGDE